MEREKKRENKDMERRHSPLRGLGTLGAGVQRQIKSFTPSTLLGLVPTGVSKLRLSSLAKFASSILMEAARFFPWCRGAALGLEASVLVRCSWVAAAAAAMESEKSSILSRSLLVESVVVPSERLLTGERGTTWVVDVRASVILSLANGYDPWLEPGGVFFLLLFPGRRCWITREKERDRGGSDIGKGKWCQGCMRVGAMRSNDGRVRSIVFIGE